MKTKSYLYRLVVGVLVSITLHSPSAEAAAVRALEEAVVMGRGALSRTVRPLAGMGWRSFSTKTFDDHEPRFAKATYDTSFKHMLSDPEIQISFLKTFTGREDIVSVKEYPISHPVLKPEEEEGRRRSESHMGFACRIEDGNIFIAEVQVQREVSWDRRALYYAAGVYSQQLDEGVSWKYLQNVIGINILDHDTRTLPDGSYEKHYMMLDTMHPEDDALPYLQIRQFELPRVDLDALADGPKKQWLQIFKHATEMKEIPEDFDPVVKKALKKLDREKWEGKIVRDYRDDELDLSRYTTALADERADGKEEAMTTIALNMIDIGRPLEEISKATGLSISQIKDLTGEEGRR